MPSITVSLESSRDDQREKYWHHVNGRVRMGKSEAKGSKSLMGMKPFVKKVVGINSNGGIVKENIPGKKSFTDSNIIGSRGVFYHFVLDEQHCYQIRYQTSRRRAETIYAAVKYGELHQVDESLAWEYARRLLCNEPLA